MNFSSCSFEINASRESFFGYMKGYSIKEKLKSATNYSDVQTIVYDYINYHNNQRYQWHWAKLSPNEFYDFATTVIYPPDVYDKPDRPAIKRPAKELGTSRASDSLLKK